MPTYQKLVRDRIPEIIQKAGKSFNSRILSEAEFIDEVNKKMHEELSEYEHAASAEEAIEELADLLELIHAASSYYGVSFEELEAVRKDKVDKRGGKADLKLSVFSRTEESPEVVTSAILDLPPSCDFHLDLE